MLQNILNRFTIDPKTTPFFYGWVVLVVGIFGLLMSTPGQTIGVSAFRDSLLQVLSMGRDELSLAYMGGTMLSAVMLTKAGRLFDQFGAMKTGLFASIGLGLAILYLSQIDKISILFGNKQTVTLLFILIGFVLIRFFGQGVLTMVSRTMVVKWFDSRRGLAVGIMGVFGAYGFSIAPVIFDSLITDHGWSGAWIVISIVSTIVFPVIIYLFFKEAPEIYGLIPDGARAAANRAKVVRFPVHRDLTLAQARKTLSLWVYAGFPALFGLVMTGFSFHVVSVFAEQGLGRNVAINIFQPIAIVSVCSTILFSWTSDYVPLKYIVLLFGVSAITSMYGLYNLSDDGFNYWFLILGYGTASGIHSLVLSLFLPRFYGKTHLGAITGQAMTLIVFCSALGPILFSQSLSITGDYKSAALICGIGFLLLIFGAVMTKNPQMKYV